MQGRVVTCRATKSPTTATYSPADVAQRAQLPLGDSVILEHLGAQQTAMQPSNATLNRFDIQRSQAHEPAGRKKANTFLGQFLGSWLRAMGFRHPIPRSPMSFAVAHILLPITDDDSMPFPSDALIC